MTNRFIIKYSFKPCSFLLSLQLELALQFKRNFQEKTKLKEIIEKNCENCPWEKMNISVSLDFVVNDESKVDKLTIVNL